MADDASIPRRQFLKGASAASTAVAAALSQTQQAEAQGAAKPAAPAGASTGHENERLTLTNVEWDFIVAAVDTLIPADELSPAASDCGVATFIDRELAGAYGAGDRMYRQGPFHKGKPGQGYQLPLTPRQFFGAGIAAMNEWSRKTHGKDFDRLSPADRTTALKDIDSGKAQLAGLDGKQFFEQLLQITMEGFFADPIYGGNRNKAGWRMVGYPGLPAVYATLIDEYRNKRYSVEPQSIGDFS